MPSQIIQAHAYVAPQEQELITSPPNTTQQPQNTQIPAFILADQLIYEHQNEIIRAVGDVEISHEGRLLHANEITYDATTGQIVARGNVWLRDRDGTFLFSPELTLDQEFASGIIEQLYILFPDNSRLAAHQAQRNETGRVTVQHAVFSACEVCREEPSTPPLWQLRAQEIVYEQSADRMSYRNVFLDFFGVPVLYLPYFSHPTELATRQTGFLSPKFGTTSILGPFIRTFYHIPLDMHRDITLETTLTSESGPLFGAVYRHRFQDAYLTLSASANYSDFTESQNGQSRAQPTQWRGHFFGDLLWHISTRWRAGAQINLTTDSSYLKAFNLHQEETLHNRAFIEGFYGFNMISARVAGYQNLRSEDITQPLVLPHVTVDWWTQPGSILGGRGFFNLDLLNLLRPDDEEIIELGNERTDTLRFSVDSGWTDQWITSFGLVTEVLAALRADLYFSNDFSPSPNAFELQGGEGAHRFFPRLSLTSRYPLVQPDSFYGTVLVEPVVSFVISPYLDESMEANIPNNDSFDVELDSVSLFQDNRFTGLDRIEEGARLAYGINLSWFGDQGHNIRFFLGQSYRFQADSRFTTGNGLEGHSSDLVSTTDIHFSPWLDVSWRLRVDEDDYEIRRYDLAAGTNIGPLDLSTSYSFAAATPILSDNGNQEEIYINSSLDIDQNWRGFGRVRYDLDEDTTRNIAFGLGYDDECTAFEVEIRRDFTESDIGGGETSVYLSLSLKHLGL